MNKYFGLILIKIIICGGMNEWIVHNLNFNTKIKCTNLVNTRILNWYSNVICNKFELEIQVLERPGKTLNWFLTQLYLFFSLLPIKNGYKIFYLSYDWPIYFPIKWSLISFFCLSRLNVSARIVDIISIESTLLHLY